MRHKKSVEQIPNLSLTQDSPSAKHPKLCTVSCAICTGNYKHELLSEQIPHLFVHQGDTISSVRNRSWMDSRMLFLPFLSSKNNDKTVKWWGPRWREQGTTSNSTKETCFEESPHVKGFSTNLSFLVCYSNDMMVTEYLILEIYIYLCIKIKWPWKQWFKRSRISKLWYWLTINYKCFPTDWNLQSQSKKYRKQATRNLKMLRAKRVTYSR